MESRQSRIRVRAGNGQPPTVDGHPGWVSQSVRQYACLCMLSMAAQGFLAATGIALLLARSAAWWCVVLSYAGGFFVWVPLYIAMRRGNVPGAPELVVFSAVFLLDALLGVRVLRSLVRQYVIDGASEIVVSLATVGALGVLLSWTGAQGLSRLSWFLKGVMLLALAASSVVLLQNAHIDNLLPLLGQSVPATLTAIPLCAGATGGVAALGLLPFLTGSAKPPRFRAGAVPLVVAAVIAGGLTLLCNLCIPPKNITSGMIWARRMMIPAEYIAGAYFFRVFYLFALLSGLLLSIGFGIALSARSMERVCRGLSRTGAVVIVSTLLAMLSLGLYALTDDLVNLMPWRLPAAAAASLVTALRLGRRA